MNAYRMSAYVSLAIRSIILDFAAMSTFPFFDPNFGAVRILNYITFTILWPITSTFFPEIGATILNLMCILIILSDIIWL